METKRHPPKTIYWHRELPPIDAVAMADHTVEADSRRITGTFRQRDELWHRCYADLMAAAEVRLRQEIERLGGHYAHVHDESITPKHDDHASESWLHGTFTYVLYRRP